MSAVTFGVIGTSRMENEQRVPVHPKHLSRLPEQLRKQLIFEKGYGEPFDISDAEIAAQTGGIASRHELFSEVGSVIVSKPTEDDLHELKEGGTLWGYVHCTQQREVTQTAIDRKLTLIAFEDMYSWRPSGQIGLHTFYKNNEMAGYCAVLHALQLKGIEANYGKQRKTIIFGFGAVSHGAIYALKAQGFTDITICIQYPYHEVREEIPGCHYVTIDTGKEGEARMVVANNDGTTRPLCDLIGEADIIINGAFQDTNNPTNYVTKDESGCFKKGALIIDVSCDEGMGFYFAKPTSFDDPMFKVGSVDYYAVDHTPSYLWESASRSISAAMLVHMPSVLAGRSGWLANETIRQAINIDAGVIQKPDILAFQHRSQAYPHNSIDTLALQA
ncbi:MAG: N(5)-(carboxyethyl)ornithine synthase [Ghiorsea sp.]